MRVRAPFAQRIMPGPCAPDGKSTARAVGSPGTNICPAKGAQSLRMQTGANLRITHDGKLKCLARPDWEPIPAIVELLAGASVKSAPVNRNLNRSYASRRPVGRESAARQIQDAGVSAKARVRVPPGSTVPPLACRQHEPPGVVYGPFPAPGGNKFAQGARTGSRQRTASSQGRGRRKPHR